MCDILQEYEKQEKHFVYWKEAMRANFLGEGKPYGREEFDKFLGEYDVGSNKSVSNRRRIANQTTSQALADVPCSMFVEDLLKAYPDAKVILTHRDPASWYASMHKTMFEWWSRPSFKLIAWLDGKNLRKLMGMMVTYLNLAFGEDWNDAETVKQRYLDHYEHVRRVVPQERLFEFQQPFEWKPLGDFLDVKVPEGAFPRLNSTDDLSSLFKYKRLQGLTRLAQNAAITVLPLVAAYGGYVWYKGWKPTLAKR